MSADGNWKITINTPMGAQEVNASITTNGMSNRKHKAGEKYAYDVLIDANGQPSNDPALLFHGSFGFRELGQNTMPQVDVRASMLAKELCSFPWVNETYGGKLPDVAWAHDRQLPAQAQRSTGT